jgi:hypothetical protein
MIVDRGARVCSVGACMRAVVIALATIVALTAPAYSQGRGKGGGRHAPSPQQSEEQKKKAAEAEKAYQSAIDKIPDKKFDPWGNMR